MLLCILCREPRKLLLHEHCLLRLTVNMSNLSQGQVAVLAELPSSSGGSIVAYVAPTNSFLWDNLMEQELFKEWPKIRIQKITSFSKSWVSSLRRTQLPFTNYVASTCHKLMGDTFDKIATQISLTEADYCLRLASQLYVIVSRVKQLCNVHFVGLR